MTQLIQIVKTLQEEIASEPDDYSNSTGGRDYLPAFFEKYVLRDILGKYHDAGDRFDSVEKFSKFMDRYADFIYQPDCTAYAWEYSSAAKSVKRIVLARYNACVV